MTGPRPRCGDLWLIVPAAAMGAVLVYGALAPADWQVRLGLHWLLEHFLGFFAFTLLVCAAAPRPMVVAAVLLPLAIGLEAAQALTPDRTPDLATALMAAAGVASGALIADLVLALRGRKAAR